MLANFFRVSLRYLSKNKTYSFINILGLAMGMACFTLLTLFVQKELSYDEYHSQKELVYQVFTADSAESGFSPAMQPPAGPHLKESIPEVTHSARFGRVENILARVDNQKFILPKIHYSDADLFTLFDIELINTTAEQVSLEKNQLILSRSEAERLYGSVDAAIGANFDFIDLDLFEVVAVFEDLPNESHLKMDLLISFDYVDDLAFWKADFQVGGDQKPSDWGFISAFPTYIKLNQADQDLQALKSKIHTALKPHRGHREIELARLDDIYFSDYNNSYFKSKGDTGQIKLYVIIAAVVLLVAIVNYTNMATARYSRRAKEVGIRKTVGGHRSQIVRQFLVESVSIALFAMVLAVCMAELTMPFFNNYTGKEIDISYQSPFTYLIFISSAVVIGLIAGSYPSFYLSRFNPLRSLNAQNSSRGGRVFRQILVGFQFTTCLALMAVTGIVYSQFNHMQTIDKGFNSEQLLTIDLQGEDTRKNFRAFKSELLKSPYVVDAAGASFSVFDDKTSFYVEMEGLEERVAMAIMIAESNFPDLLGVKMAAGKMYSEMAESERSNYILINEHSVDLANWENPLDKTLVSRKIGGVVEDFIFGSAKEAIDPLMIMCSNAESYATIYIKITGGVKPALEQIENVYNRFSEEYPFEFKFVDEQFASKYEGEMKLSQVLGTFSGLTIFIAGLGILGLSIFIAEQRIKEIGIRKVMGASLGQIIWLLNSSVTKLIMVISLITLPLVYYFIRDWLNNFAYNIDLNGMYFIGPLVLLLGVVWSILFYQSVRSARANPVNALRTE